MESFKFIDLFCGIGGFHQAMKSLGGVCVFASDIDEDCRKTYEANYGIAPVGDITKIDAADIPAHDVLCGGFPCQAFSKAGNRLGFDDPTKGTLFFDICRILEYHHPKYALLENVRNLADKFEDSVLTPSIAFGVAFKENVEETISEKISEAEYEMFINKLDMKNAPGYREKLEKGLK